MQNQNDIGKKCNRCQEPIISRPQLSRKNNLAGLCSSCAVKATIEESFKMNGVSYTVPENIKILAVHNSPIAIEALAQLLYLGQHYIPHCEVSEFTIQDDGVRFIAKGVNGQHIVSIEYNFGEDLYRLVFSKIMTGRIIEEIDQVYFDDMVRLINNFLISVH